MSNINSIYLLIILFFSIISTSKEDDEFPLYTKRQKEILDSSCSHHPLVCPMIYAIEDVFKQIQSEEIKVINNYCNKLCIMYNNIHARDIICETTTIPANDFDCEIKFGNCNVLLSGEIGYDNTDYKTINFGTFLSELKFSSISFNRSSKFKRMDLNIENSTIKYNYDKNNSLFQSWNEDLREQMDDILEKVYDEYIIKLRDKIKPVMSKENIYEETKRRLIEKNFTFFKGPGLFDKIKNVTYISYSGLTTTFKDSIIIKDKIFFYNFLVDFQYALNNNVTYNNGYFILKNVCFEGDEQKKNNYYNTNIKNIIKDPSTEINHLNNSDQIWEVIVNDFKNKFNENKVNYDVVNERTMRFFR